MQLSPHAWPCEHVRQQLKRGSAGGLRGVFDPDPPMPRSAGSATIGLGCDVPPPSSEPASSTDPPHPERSDPKIPISSRALDGLLTYICRRRDMCSAARIVRNIIERTSSYPGVGC
jgi:hypothetical protein